MLADNTFTQDDFAVFIVVAKLLAVAQEGEQAIY